MDQFNSRNDDDEHFRAVAHDLHDLHAQTNPQILAEKLHKFFVKHSGLHPDQARNVVEGMFQKAGHATHFADGGPVDKALNVVGQQQADPVAVAKQVASMPPVRQLSPMGLYSHGAETAAALPQAKGSPQQMAANLRRLTVRPEELYHSGIADETATLAKRTMIESQYAPKVEAAKQAMEGLAPGTPEFTAAERQFKNISSSMRAEMDNAMVLHPDWASRPNVTREELAQHFQQRMPQVEETVLGGKQPFDVNRLKELEKEYAGLKQHPIDDPSFGEEKYNELIQLMNIRDQSSTQSLYDAADQATRSGQRAQRQGNNVTAEKYFREAEFLNARAEKLDLEGKGLPNPTKFNQYTLPGGENYREVLLKMPEMAWQGPEKGFQPTSTTFRSSHWDDPNVLAHLRMSDRTGPNGEKILHLEELQSDWGQKGKKEGFVTQYKPEDIKPMDPANITSERRRNEFWNFETPTGAIDVPRNDRWPTMEAARQHILDNVKPTGVPTAPYVTNTQAWTDLALKRALREAAEGGYDKLVWTPGAEQAKRYSLSNHVDEVQYSPGRNGTHSVEAYKGNNNVFNKPNATIKEIADTFGQEIADKIASGHGEVNRNTGYNVLSGLDLETGGEGMKGYYDKIVPKRLQELVKKHDPDAKVGYTDVMLPPKGGAGHNNPPFEAPGLTITPKMRESILRGQPAFKRGGAIPLHPALNIPGVHIRTAEAGEPFFHGEK